jgi:hypothetical protein
VIREREGDGLLKGVIGSIILLKALEVSAAEVLTGMKDLTGDGATYHSSEAVHALSEGLLKGLLARCVIIVRRQITRAAAFASISATRAIRLAAELATWAMSIARDHHRTATGTNSPPIPLDKFDGASDSVSMNVPIGIRLSADRLETWRSAFTIVANISLRSCAEGRAYGPSLQLAPRRRSRGRTAGGGDTSGPDSPHAARWRRGRRSLEEDSAKLTSMYQLPMVATIPRSSATQFEGARRLGRRLPLPRTAAATLPPAPAVARLLPIG